MYQGLLSPLSHGKLLSRSIPRIHMASNSILTTQRSILRRQDQCRQRGKARLSILWLLGILQRSQDSGAPRPQRKSPTHLIQRLKPPLSTISDISFATTQVESFLTLLFASDPEQVKTSFCPYGAARAWVTAGKTSPLPHFITSAEFKTHSSFFSPSYGESFGPPLK